MRGRTAAATALLILTPLSALAVGGLRELARQGRWSTILEIAQRREAQFPVTGVQALVAAEAARRSGEPELRRRYLETTLDDAIVGPVARIELAEMLVTEQPERGVELVLPLFRHSPSRELRRAAARVAARAVNAGVSATTRSRLRGELRRLPRGARRLIEVELAITGNHRHRELQKILEADRTDLADLRAAEVLPTLGPTTPKERWLVARSLYRHAHYTEALQLLEGLTSTGHRGVVLWRARFLRGRCTFRLERWREAAAWYRKARAAARRREDRASLLVHEGRALELAGNLDAAAGRARKALQTRPSDDRRLFLARLELARGHGRTAVKVLSSVRRRTARDRGLLLRAIDAHSRGDDDDAIALLTTVSGRVWRGPALVLAAEAALDQGKIPQAVSFLEAASKTRLQGFWALEAIRLARELPPDQRQRWGAEMRAELSAGPPSLRQAVIRFSTLVTDPGDRGALRQAVGQILGLRGEAATMAWRAPLARQLWEGGLAGEAGRWDPRGFPGATAFEATWSARQLLLAGNPYWAIRLADGALQRLGSGLPADIIPLPLQRSLFPLPFPGPVAEAAGRHGIPWSLLAAVAREESRWNPRALSAVGARGLTQLMPETARKVAVRLHLPPPSPDDLFRPPVGLRLGAAELARLLQVFGGRQAVAIAAYNAGEPQARLWLRTAGASSGDAWFLAAIGFSATRSYTGDVLWAQHAYGEVWPKITGTPGKITEGVARPTL